MERKLYKCEFCGKTWETDKSHFTCHCNHCNLNPNGIPYKPFKAKNPELRKKKISETMKRKALSGEIRRWTIDRSIEPFSEKYFREWLEKEQIPFEKNLHVNRFFLDFAFGDKKVYFEVNGEQHYQKMYNGQDYQERDSQRKQILEKDGWKCLVEIRWSDFQASSLEEKKVFLSNLKQSILNSTVVDINYKTKEEKEKQKRLEKEEKEKQKKEQQKIIDERLSKKGYTLEVRKRLSEKHKGSRNAAYGTHWYTNGVQNVMAKNCPEGFHLGRVFF